MILGKVFKGMGGAMDLVGNADQTNIVVATKHAKVVEQCSKPLTGPRVISTIITDSCVFEVNRMKGGLTLVEWLQVWMLKRSEVRRMRSLRLPRSR